MEVHHLSRSTRRGLPGAIVKYPLQTVDTVRLLVRERPDVVFVQNPPSFAPLVVAAYCAIAGARFVVDAHSDAMMSPLWTRPEWLYRRVARRAMATIVTNEHFAGIIRARGGRALVVQDIPAEFPDGEYVRGEAFTVAVVNTFAEDEPLSEVVDAARALEDVTFLVTGDPSRAPQGLVAALPENVRFTGFLPDPDYYGLLRSSDTVMCLTTRDHTMQRGACEALSLGKPIITSDWPILSDYFSLGTVHVDNSAPGIRDGVVEMRRGLREYQRGIVELHAHQTRQWEEAHRALLGLLAGPGDGH